MTIDGACTPTRSPTDLGEDLENLECEHPSPCPENPVARVPLPNEITAKGMNLCPFHLALWIDLVDDDLDPDVIQLADDDALTQLENVPPWTGHNGRQWSRLGIDHSGDIHYYRELGDDQEDTARILLVDHRLAVQDVKRVPGYRDITAWIEYVRQKRGWMRLDPAARDAHERRDV